MLRLGLFREFKGYDTAVLIAADAATIIALIDAVAATSVTEGVSDLTAAPLERSKPVIVIGA